MFVKMFVKMFTRTLPTTFVDISCAIFAPLQKHFHKYIIDQENT